MSDQQENDLEEKNWFELTSEEVMERLFGKEVMGAVKKLLEKDEDENDEASIS